MDYGVVYVAIILVLVKLMLYVVMLAILLEVTFVYFSACIHYVYIEAVSRVEFGNFGFIHDASVSCSGNESSLLHCRLQNSYYCSSYGFATCNG